MKNLFILLVFSFHICNGQALVQYKGVHIYNSTKNVIAPTDKGFVLIQNTLDTIMKFHTVYDICIRVPNCNFNYSAFDIDQVFNNTTFFSRFPHYISEMDNHVEDYGGILVLVVKFPNKKQANNNKRAVLKHFNKYGYDVFTDYISCTVHGNYLRFITFSGDESLYPKKLISAFKVEHKYLISK